MEHFSIAAVLVALVVAGAIRVVPLILEDLRSAFERSLDIIAAVIHKYRAWRAELWPSRTAQRR